MFTHFGEHIFQMGWFNQQPVYFINKFQGTIPERVDLTSWVMGSYETETGLFAYMKKASNKKSVNLLS